MTAVTEFPVRAMARAICAAARLAVVSLAAMCLASCGGGGGGDASGEAPDAASGWSTPQRLDDGQGPILDVRVWHDAAGVEHAAWVQKLPTHQVLHAVHVAADGRWVADGPALPMDELISGPPYDAVAHASGTLAVLMYRSYFVGPDALTSLNAAVRSPDGTWIWSVLDDGSFGDGRLAALPDGDLIAVWRKATSPTSLSSQLMAARWDARSASWGTPVPVSAPGVGTNTVHVAATPAGAVVALWTAESTGSSDKQIFWSVRPPGAAATWSAPAALSNVFTSGGFASLAAMGERVHVVAGLGRPGVTDPALVNTLEARSCDVATLVCDATQVLPATPFGGAWIAATASQAQMLWIDEAAGTAGSATLQSARYDVVAQRWSAPLALSTTGEPRSGGSYQLGMDATGHALVTFMGLSGTRWAPMWSRFDGASWRATGPIDTTTAGTLVSMQASVAASGKAAAVWGSQTSAVPPGRPGSTMEALFVSRYRP